MGEEKRKGRHGMRYAPEWLTLLYVGIAAICAAIVATILSFALIGVISEALTPNYVWIFYASAITSFIVGPLLWWLLILRNPPTSPGKGVAVGVLTSFIAHPFTWLFALLLARIAGSAGFIWMSMADISSQNIASVILTLSIESVQIVGWLTTIVGGLTGALLGALLSRTVQTATTNPPQGSTASEPDKEMS
jgi:MFS family permease